jgi:transposase
MGWYDRKRRRVRDLSCGDTRVYLELEVRRLDCRRCGMVKREQLDFLADNPLYTKRFAYHVGRRCRGAAIKEVGAELRLDWLRSRRSTDSTWKPSSSVPERQVQRRSALTRSRSGKVTATGSWSAI